MSEEKINPPEHKYSVFFPLRKSEQKTLGRHPHHPSGIRPPADPKGVPLFIFLKYLKYPFLVTGPTIFLKAPWAPIYTIFEGGARAEKTQFLVKIFQKVLKNGFFDLLFQKIACGAEILASVFLVLQESSQNLFDRPEKRSSNFRKFFETPPRENPRSAPDFTYDP